MIHNYDTVYTVTGLFSEDKIHEFQLKKKEAVNDSAIEIDQNKNSHR